MQKAKVHTLAGQIQQGKHDVVGNHDDERGHKRAEQLSG